ncbi:hypothetical protein GCM10020295_79260 [Streptomyces cinereospinus]
MRGTTVARVRQRQYSSQDGTTTQRKAKRSRRWPTTGVPIAWPKAMKVNAAVTVARLQPVSAARGG